MTIAIIGAGGHGRCILEVIREKSKRESVFFFDQRIKDKEQEWMNGDLVLSIQRLSEGPSQDYPEFGLIVGIGDNCVRYKYQNKFREKYTLTSVISRRAILSNSTLIAAGCFVAPGAIVGSHTLILSGAIVNSGAIVEHECVIGVCAHVAPGAKLAGHVKVGARAFIGIGATVIQNVTIGDDAIVGAGAVVLNDVLPGAKVVGCPAREIPEFKVNTQYFDQKRDDMTWWVNTAGIPRVETLPHIENISVDISPQQVGVSEKPGYPSQPWEKCPESMKGGWQPGEYHSTVQGPTIGAKI